MGRISRPAHFHDRSDRFLRKMVAGKPHLGRPAPCAKHRRCCTNRDATPLLKSLPHLGENDVIRFQHGDVRTFAFPEGRFDTVIHMATTSAEATFGGEKPLEKFTTSAFGTQRVLEFAARCGARRFLLTSSGNAYGPIAKGSPPISENHVGAPDIENPVASALGEGKRAAELLARIYAENHALKPRYVVALPLSVPTCKPTCITQPAISSGMPPLESPFVSTGMAHRYAPSSTRLIWWSGFSTCCSVPPQAGSTTLVRKKSSRLAHWPRPWAGKAEARLSSKAVVQTRLPPAPTLTFLPLSESPKNSALSGKFPWMTRLTGHSLSKDRRASNGKLHGSQPF